MEKLLSKRQLIIFISFTSITFSNSQFFINRGWDDPIAYFGYFLLLCGIFAGYVKLPKAYRININRNLVIALSSFSIGLLLQPMNFGLKIRLLLTMAVIALTALASDNLMESFEDMRVGAYGLLAGEAMAFSVALFTGTRVFSDAEENVRILSRGFNAGMSHKNYFGMILMASFSVIYMYRKYVQKKTADLIVLFVEFFLILFSHSRAVWILTVLFLAIVSTDKIKVKVKLNINKLIKTILILLSAIVMITAIWWIYRNILRRSATYVSRISGLMSYWRMYCRNDAFHLFLGNAASFFGTEESYYDNFRRLINYGGAVDMAVLNILIKNGLTGFMGYILIFGRIVRQAVKTKFLKYRTCCLAIVIPMIVSMFSENCVSTISLSYAPFCYVVLASLYRQMRIEDDNGIKHCEAEGNGQTYGSLGICEGDRERES